jgi:FkbH-like protein
MAPSITALPWLPPPPDDFSARCRELKAGTTNAGNAIALLGSFNLSPLQSLALARAIARCRPDGLAPLSDLRLGVLASATIDLVLDCIPAAAARHGVAVEMVTAPYDQLIQQALEPTSTINGAKLDAVLLAVDHRWLKLDRAEMAIENARSRVADAAQRTRTVIEGLRSHGGAPAIVQTIPVPPQALFGSFDRRWAGSVRSMIDAFNHELISVAEETESYVLDVAALAERIGTDQWFDPVRWYSYKLPFAAECFSIYADVLGRLLGAIRGKSRKCLVLDLDNTLWGGVIGDDGLEGLALGQGGALGEAHLSIQQLAIDLRARGILLAVCSKNDDAVARRPFREHPEMVLKENHIAVFRANWQDKPLNLEAIARALNIGLDALVMLDDNPAERAQIRAALPVVAVPELPSDPSWFAWTLWAAGYFEAVAYSSEDATRAESYASDTLRAEVRATTRDLGDYLASLEMALSCTSFDVQNRKRIAQLINKTNQFNLTTKRYTEVEVAAMEGDASLITLQVRLSDKFGGLGMIGVIIARPAADQAAYEIDTWLMSCRVLGRRVEEAMLSALVAEAHKKGVETLIGLYVPTARNSMVSNHFEKLGFSVAEEVDGRRRYHLQVEKYIAPALPFAPYLSHTGGDGFSVLPAISSLPNPIET